MPSIARVVAALILLLAAACGGTAAQPTPSATPRPTPGCGNEIVDPGELCDGQDFCSSTCQVALDGCCEVTDPAGGSVCGAQGPSPQACVTLGGRFSVGTTCRGSDCTDGACFGDGRCESDPITPVTLCCDVAGGGCYDEEVSSTGALGGFLFSCQVDGDGCTPVVGSCGSSGACEPLGG